MNRRALLKRSALLGLLSQSDRSTLLTVSLPKRATRSHTFTIGRIEAMVISDGHVVKTPVQPSFAPGFSPAAVANVLEENFASTAQIDLALNILLLRIDGRLILIDTGCGHHFGQGTGWLVSNLLQAGLKPQDITDIIITHAHPDHIGGLSDKTGKLIFKKATIYLSKKDYTFWMSAKPDFSNSKMNSDREKKALVEVAQANIRAAGAGLHLFEDGDELLGCMRMRLAPGHTPGHTLINVQSEGQTLSHIVDLVHSDVLTFAHPEWGVDSDVDYEQAVASRRKVMDELTTTRALTFAYHLPWPGLGHVRARQDGFEWIPKTGAIPD